MKTTNLSSYFLNNGCKILAGKNKSFISLNRKKIIYLFEKFGCILFRGFNFEPSNYKKFTNLFTSVYANDTNNFTRRNRTSFDKDIRYVDIGHKAMNLHSEASFSPSWPEIIWFYCVDPSKKHGETTICDGISLWSMLSQKTKNFFLSNPIKYDLKIPVIKKKQK